MSETNEFADIENLSDLPFGIYSVFSNDIAWLVLDCVQKIIGTIRILKPTSIFLARNLRSLSACWWVK